MSKTSVISAFVVLFLILVLNTFAQDQNKNKNNLSYKDALSELYGTYQIQIINTRNKPFLPENLSEIIKSNRDSTEVKFVNFSADVRLKILPFFEISSNNFKPIESSAYIRE